MDMPVKVSVNVSALEFRQPDFVDRLKSVLEASGLPAQWLSWS
jgi:EAL domain-containing protein (putative c-di-GMP-specific phosphodiesterase class I)